jgi:F-type H+-transporting ATPase subunit delta
MTSIIGRNYSRALFELASETSSLDAVEADLRATRDALFADREIRAFLTNRLIGRPTKKRLIRGAFEGKVDTRVLHLLLLMVDRGRMKLLGEVTEDFEARARIARGVRKVKLATAFPLGPGETLSVTRSLEARYNAQVELEVEIRPSLIGGVVALSEGQEIELSIQGRMKSLSAALEGR